MKKKRIKGRSCQYTPTTKEALKLVIDSKLPYNLFQKSASFLTLLLFDEIRSTFVSALSLMKQSTKDAPNREGPNGEMVIEIKG